MIRRRLTGLLACLVIVAILVGLPIVLLTVGGNPIPDRWPTIGRIADWLTRPDDGSLALEAICLAGWIVWLLLGTLIGFVVGYVCGFLLSRYVLQGFRHMDEVMARASGVSGPRSAAM